MTALSDTKAVIKADAFELKPTDVLIPIDRSKYKPEFTRRWFQQRNQSTYSIYLPSRYLNDKPHNIMLIGVFEGADLLWMCQNLLGHPDSRILGIDPWTATRKIDSDGMNSVYGRARKNVRPFSKQVQLVRDTSQHLLPILTDAPTKVRGKEISAGEWDLIIVDGDHNADPVLEDAENALKLIRPGQWILFDDVRNRRYKKDHVYHGIIAWLLESGKQVEMVWAHRHMNCYRRIVEK